MSVDFKFNRPFGMTRSSWEVLAGKALGVTRSVTPVDTGRLRSSWDVVNQSSRSITLQTADSIAPYAKFVNNGTPKMAARDFTGAALKKLSLLSGKYISVNPRSSK